jgi:hypothetical protein
VNEPEKQTEKTEIAKLSEQIEVKPKTIDGSPEPTLGGTIQPPIPPITAAEEPEEPRADRIARIMGPLAFFMGGCWIWKGHLDNSSGNSLPMTSKKYTLPGVPPEVSARRAIYLYFNGPISPDYYAVTTCNVEKCTHPDHIIVVTKSDILKRRARAKTKNVIQDGKLKTVPKKTKTTREYVTKKALAKFINARLKPNGTCQDWTGTMGDNNKIPRMPRGSRKSMSARRIAWEIKHGSVPPKSMSVVPKCSNGRCMNVDHFKLITASETTSLSHAARRANTARAKKANRPAPVQLPADIVIPIKKSFSWAQFGSAVASIVAGLGLSSSKS